MNNGVHLTILFISEWSRKEINFLGMTVKFPEESSLYSDLYKKTTDSKSYMLYDSTHPQKGLPYSQYLCLRRICQEESDLEKDLNIKESLFQDRGYPEDVLKNAREKAFKMERTELLKEKVKPMKKEGEDLPHHNFLTKPNTRDSEK